MLRRTRILGTSSLLAVGLVVSGGYLVNALTAPSTTTITACSNIKTGAVRVIAPTRACSKSEKRLTWNVKGPAGARGLTGLRGATGATGAAGAAGVPGTDGLPGADGQDGATGATGATGPEGPAGPAGKNGAIGPQGPAGPAGGTAVVDPNPNNLTYRMKFGTDPILQITNFTQKLADSGTTYAGGGTGAGKPTFENVIVTLPMNSRVLAQMNNLAKGTHVPSATVEMCKPGEPTGHCTLELGLSEVMVVGVDVRQDPTQATVTVERLDFAKEKMSFLPGTPQATVYEWNIAQNVAGASSGSALATSTGDTTYTTTLTGSTPLGVISTRSWRGDHQLRDHAGGRRRRSRQAQLLRHRRRDQHRPRHPGPVPGPRYWADFHRGRARRLRGGHLLHDDRPHRCAGHRSGPRLPEPVR